MPAKDAYHDAVGRALVGRSRTIRIVSFGVNATSTLTSGRNEL
jgi:hypothetical protein